MAINDIPPAQVNPYINIIATGEKDGIHLHFDIRTTPSETDKITRFKLTRRETRDLIDELVDALIESAQREYS